MFRDLLTAAFRGIATVLLVAAADGTAFAQTVGLNQVMRSKLVHTQKILEAVVTSNWQFAGRGNPGTGASHT